MLNFWSITNQKFWPCKK